MQEIRLLKGNHPSAFDADGNATMCGEEYVAWAAGEPHSDWPDCASHVLKTFTRSFNDALEDEQRQRLRPYLIPQVGTAGDGQDEARRFMAADWLVRAHAPAFLEAAGLAEGAERLRGLSPIEGAEQARAAMPDIRDVRIKARAPVDREALRGTAPNDACRAVLSWPGWFDIGSGSGAARDAALGSGLEAAPGADAVLAVRSIAVDAAVIVARTSPNNPWAALRPIVEDLREGAFGLLGRMLDPAGMHDVPEAAELDQEAPHEKTLPNPREEVKA